MTLRKILKTATIAGLACGILAMAAGDAEAQKRIRWKMGSTYPGSLTQLGTLA